MTQQQDPTAGLVMSYLGLRRAVGVVAVLLPFLLLGGKLLIDGPGVPGSVSAFYYTSMRNVLVGLLFMQGTFLLSYRYDRRDTIAAVIAGVAVIGVALFPTQPANPTPTDVAIGVIHLICAGTFFLTTAYFSLFLFTLSDGHPTRRKLQRNVVYRVAGVVILVCLVLQVVTDNLLPRAVVDAVHPVFWLESLAIIAFGVSWLVKGETVLRDDAV
ncbi:DUF7103 family protein [Pseudonocardia sp. CA-107938]|uniref:DUF7103 family protein n=1 Tax=Pseudonocardia sp. CA-107938 TaxID=3240021 RepID=UPI003D93D29B